MNKHLKSFLFLTTVIILAATAGGARAQIDLRFSPPDTTIEPGDTTRVSVMLDDAIHFRTIELTVTYDSTLISTVTGGQGALFSDSGFFIWEGFEESVPGLWHGFAIVMGAIDSLSGPGELFAWDVTGLVEGTTPITSIETNLYEPDATLIAGVGLDPTTLRVRWAPTSVNDLPSLGKKLDIFPNPFNPGTRIRFDLPAAGHVALSVYDARGRHVATLHDGQTDAGPLHFDWNGRDDQGLVQPGGVYLFRLVSTRNGDRHSAVAKGLLLK
ncbi:MAG: FlgD immunoglobulin-like domain containing protein [Candidatus Krumholzibacteriota bacterium]